MEGQTPRTDIERRMWALGVTDKALAERAHVDRGQLAKIKTGDVRSPRSSTVAAIERALTELEEEINGEPQDGGHQVTVTIELRGGFKVTVNGPVDDLAELEASAMRLLSQVEAKHAE